MSEREFESYLRLLGGLLRLDAKQRDEIAVELRDHLEERLAELIGQGVPREQAAMQALEEFGDAAGLAGEFVQIAKQRKRRWIMRMSAVSIGSVSAAILLVWAMWPEHARVPVMRPIVAQSPSDQKAQPEKKTEAKATAQAEIAAQSQEQRILAALDQTTEIMFTETSLKDVVGFLSTLHEIPIDIDLLALNESGLTADQPINSSLKGLRLRSALNRMLSDVNLTWTIRDEMLEITTPQAVEQQLQTKVYDVRPFVTETSLEYDTFNGEQLVGMIESCVAPNSWNHVGGAGSLKLTDGMLVVNQTWHAHYALESLLANGQKLSQRLESDRSEPAALIAILGENMSDTEQRIRQELNVPTNLEFTETPLRDVLEFIADRHQVPIQWNQPALASAGISTDAPVTCSYKDISLQAALRRMLRQLSLTFCVRDEVLLITTDESAEASLATRIYSLADLLPRADDFHPPGHAVEDNPPGRADEFAALILLNVGRPQSGWTDEGGTGVVLPFPGLPALVITQTDSVHQQVEKLLTDLRRSKSLGAASEIGPNAHHTVIANGPRLKVYHIAVDETGKPVVEMNGLVEMISQLVEPESWNKDTYINSIGNKLVVRHTPAVQRQVRRFLTQELRLQLLPPGMEGMVGGGLGGGGIGGGGLGGVPQGVIPASATPQ